jgi:hypothetical protein
MLFAAVLTLGPDSSAQNGCLVVFILARDSMESFSIQQHPAVSEKNA